jgi:two-component system, NtrC family, response regulator
MNTPKLMIVDDDEGIRIQLKYALQSEFTLRFASDRKEAVEQAAEWQPALVLLDLGLPPDAAGATEGLQALQQLLESHRGIKVIILTGNTERETALKAVQIGAFDYHQKPIDLDPLRAMLRRAAYLQDLEQEGEQIEAAREQTTRFEDIIGTHPAMRDIFGIIQRVAKTDATVLIEGESGTGKELVARAIHQRSRRRDAAFVAINCGAIPESLLEAELFGHEKGAFTGAHIQRRGKFELADHGTLFLDEIGELSVLLQVKLLRFLQERTIERVGGREPIRVDCRVIAATNRNMRMQLEQGHFREDLYYRLSVVSIQVPPLRERTDDIMPIANAFLARAGAEHRRKLRFSQAAVEAMLAYPWPGNIRELENKVQRATIMARGRYIEPENLDVSASEAAAESLRSARGRAEREVLVEMLSRHRGNISQAARELRVSRPTLHGLLSKHQVNAKDFR